MATFEGYQVLEELGSGSFGVVYKAIEKATGETVAIKLVRLPFPHIIPIPTTFIIAYRLLPV